MGSLIEKSREAEAELLKQSSLEDIWQPPTKTEIVISQQVSPKKGFVLTGFLIPEFNLVSGQNKTRGDTPHPYNKTLIKIGPNSQPVKSKIDKSDVGDVSVAKILFACDLSD